MGWSDEILGFDCGGQQWVLETAFPAGTQQQPDGRRASGWAGGGLRTCWGGWSDCLRAHGGHMAAE